VTIADEPELHGAGEKTPARFAWDMGASPDGQGRLALSLPALVRPWVGGTGLLRTGP
jgi:hypothetical protein